MSFALELADSEVLDVVAAERVVSVRFSAASVRNAGGERGWLPTVQLTLGAATLDGDAAHAFGRITEGVLRQDGRAVARPPLHATLHGEVELTLRFANGTLLTARGHTLTLDAEDDARFAEDLSC